MEQINNYFHVTYEKEGLDSTNLINQIAKSGWVDNEMTIINCSPDYSSRLTQMVNHKLSYLNANETFEVIDLPMPYPIMFQIWDTQERKFIQFDRYLFDWVRKYILPNGKYLFLDSGTLRGKNFTKVYQAIKDKVDRDKIKFASLYLESDSIFTPDFFVQKFDKEKQGGLLFEWENVNNPNWDY
jgi:hypothetical protein